MNYRPLLLLASFLICVVLAVVVNLLFAVDIVYTHLFYIPIILTGIWYPRYALLMAAALGLIHIACDHATAETFKFGALLRAVLFVAVASVTRHLALRQERLLHSLRESEERFAKVFRLSPAPLMISSIDEGRFLDVNDQGLAMLGYLRKEMVGRTSAELSLFKDGEVRDAYVKKLVQQGFLRSEPVQLRTKQGGIREVLWSAETIHHQNGNVILSLFYDITERQQAENERAKLLSRLQKAISDINVLSGLIPICSSCKKIRDDKGYWNLLESYIEAHSAAEFSHGICPECMKKLNPNYYEKHYKKMHHID